ncbi:MAG: hypothetical protein AAFP82_11280 [Bacteroidota bacterium]
MALSILLLACFLFYGTSKYFPIQYDFVKDHKTKLLILASVVSLLSLYLFTSSFDFATALMIWILASMTLLSAVILSVKMNTKWLWLWGFVALLFIIIDLN